MAWGITSALNVATSALQTKQQQMSVVSTNLANADNTDYHRRTANATNYNVSGTQGGGSGVYVASVTREYDLSLETSLHSAIASNSYEQEYYNRTSQIENVVGANGDNYLNDSVVDFSDKLQALAATPQSASSRAALLSSASTMCSAFNQQYDDLASLRDAIAIENPDSTVSGSISTQVNAANDILEQINTLNGQIRLIEDNTYMNQQALDLRDQRDALVKQLSQYGDFSFKEEANNQYTITLNYSGGSVMMIDATDEQSVVANTLDVQMDASDNPQIYLKPASGASTLITLNSGTGSIRALQDARNYVKTQMTDLYEYAKALGDTINTLQGTGYNQDGVQVATSKIFDPVAAQPSSGVIISVNTILANSPRLIAAASNAASAGDGTNATAMWTALNTNGSYKNQTLVAYSDEILTQVSQEVSRTMTQAANTASVQAMFESAVSTRSSVSSDDEMVSMLQLQRSYQSAAKMVTVIDEMLQTVINM